MTIYLLRHGELEDNLPRRFVGQIDLALSDVGVRQAKWWRDEFFAKKNIRLQKIFTSDLARCRKTAEIIAGDRDNSKNNSGIHEIEVLPERGLREIDLGKWDGLPMSEIRKRFPGDWEKRGEEIGTFRPWEGESFTDVYNRVIPLFTEICETGANPVLIVAHSGVNRLIICHILGMPISRLFSIGQGYSAMNIIEQGKENLIIAGMNLLPDLEKG
jgi:probable phosphoglycerate mutase